VLLIVSAAIGGIVFSCLGQPVCLSLPIRCYCCYFCPIQIIFRVDCAIAPNTNESHPWGGGGSITPLFFPSVISEYLCGFQMQVIVGYLLAGSLIGPGGLKYISEMVQVCYCHNVDDCMEDRCTSFKTTK